jgi:tetratricopeptide (TPR) repeat protein
MNFSRATARFLLLLLLLLLPAGCRRTITNEERSARNELRRDLRAHAFEAAIPLARRVLRVAPQDNGAWARLAQAQAGLGDLTGLRQTLADWHRAVPRTSAKYDEYRGDLALASGRSAEALAAWTVSVAQKDRKPRVFAKMGRLEAGQGQWEKAAAAWSGALQLEESAPLLLERARANRHLHRWDAVLSDLQRAARLAPNDALVRQMNLQFARLGKFLAEVRDLDQELAAMPNETGLRADRALLFLRAAAPDLALDDARVAAEQAADAVRPRLFAALALQGLNRAREANRFGVRGALSLDALSPDFLQTLARLDAEIGAEPKSAELRINRAWQLNEIEQPQLALRDAEAASNFDPKSAGSHAEASYALAKLGRAPEAYSEIKRATELDPNFSTAWQYRGELEMKKIDYLAAIDSLTHALAINQTAAALAKREECYRRLGLLVKAEADQKSLDRIRAIR